MGAEVHSLSASQRLQALRLVPAAEPAAFAVMRLDRVQALCRTRAEARHLARRMAEQNPGQTVEVFERACAFRTETLVREL